VQTSAKAYHAHNSRHHDIVTKHSLVQVSGSTSWLY